MLKRISGCLIALLLAAPAAFAQAPTDVNQDPYIVEDDSWLRLHGTVLSHSDDGFLLDFGDGVITVEVDDWDLNAETEGLRDGAHVTVYGRVDDDLFEFTKIEASSVYAGGPHAFFHANAADEEDADARHAAYPGQDSRTTVHGQIHAINPEADAFTLDMGDTLITVETDAFALDPLDDVGPHVLEVGDRVSVSGEIDDRFLNLHILESDRVVTLSDG